MNLPQLTYIDLFCGAGGASIGLGDQGFDLILANDIDRIALETFKHNLKKIHKNTKQELIIHGDIKDLYLLLNLKGARKRIRTQSLGYMTITTQKEKQIYENIPKIVNNKEIQKALKNKKIVKNIDLLIGGPPCQGYSLIGRSKRGSKVDRAKGFVDDPRNQLFKYFLACAKKFDPKVVVIENVKGLSSSTNYRDLIEVSLRRTGRGYITYSLILNAKDFGVPQHRERLFFIGVRSDIAKKSKWTEASIAKLIIDRTKTHKNNDRTNLQSAIDDLPKIIANPVPNNYAKKDEIAIGKKGSFGENISSKKYNDLIFKKNNYRVMINKYRNKIIKPLRLFNHKARFHNENDKQIYLTLRPGKYLNHPENKNALKRVTYGIRLDADGQRYLKGFVDKYFKLDSKQPSKTIIAHLETDGNSFVHPGPIPRSITPREAARIQSFPDWYEFRGPTRRQFRQIGNAIPPLLARVIGKIVRDILDKKG